MKLPRYELKVTEPKTVGKTIAYVRVQVGLIWLSCRLDESKGKCFLNPPSTFVENLEGRPRAGGGTHTGWISTAGFDPDLAQDIKQRALAELGLKEAVLAPA